MSNIVNNFNLGEISITEEYNISATQSEIDATPYFLHIDEEYGISFINLEKVEKPKVNKKESKKIRAAIVAEKSKATAPIKKQMQEIEEEVEKLEDALEDARVKLSRDIPKIEKEIENKFALLEELQTKLDVMNKEFEIRMSEV